MVCGQVDHEARVALVSAAVGAPGLAVWAGAGAEEPMAALTACWQAPESLALFCSRHWSEADPPAGTLEQ